MSSPDFGVIANVIAARAASNLGDAVITTFVDEKSGAVETRPASNSAFPSPIILASWKPFAKTMFCLCPASLNDMVWIRPK